MRINRPKIVKPNAKNRNAPDHLADGVSYFSTNQNKTNCIIHEPLAEIPAREKWLFNNKKALIQVKKGIQDSAADATSSRGSFSEFIDEDKK